MFFKAQLEPPKKYIRKNAVSPVPLIRLNVIPIFKNVLISMKIGSKYNK